MSLMTRIGSVVDSITTERISNEKVYKNSIHYPWSGDL